MLLSRCSLLFLCATARRSVFCFIILFVKIISEAVGGNGFGCHLFCWKYDGDKSDVEKRSHCRSPLYVLLVKDCNAQKFSCCSLARFSLNDLEQ
jgi:hypothetical protein